METQLAQLDNGAQLAATTPLDQNPCAVYLASLSTTGRRGMFSKLKGVAQLLGFRDPLRVPWSDLRFSHLSAIRAQLIERGQSPSTINTTLAAVRGVLRCAYNLGLLSGDEYQRARSVQPVHGSRLPRGRALPQDEIGAVLAACTSDHTAAGARDAALIGLLYAGGLRRSEAAALDLDHWHPETREVVVLGKGNRERRIWLENGGGEALADWISVRGDAPGALFCPVDHLGRVHLRRMRDQAVYMACRKRCTEAGIASFSPHDLRRTFVGDLLDGGADIVTVQKLAGHADPNTTARYDRRPDRVRRQACALLHVPYRRPTEGAPCPT